MEISLVPFPLGYDGFLRSVLNILISLFLCYVSRETILGVRFHIPYVLISGPESFILYTINIHQNDANFRSLEILRIRISFSPAFLWVVFLDRMIESLFSEVLGF